MIGFRIALALNGIRTRQLWHMGESLLYPTTTTTVGFAIAGSNLAATSSVLAVITSIFSITLMGIAHFRKDTKAILLGALCLVISAISGLVAINLELTITRL